MWSSKRSWQFMRSLATSIAAILIASSCEAADNEDFADFKIYELGEPVALECNTTDSAQAVAIEPLYEPVGWILPDLSIVTVNRDRFELQNDKWTLFINETVASDLGNYHCMMLNTSNNESGLLWTDYYLVKVGLNAEGPYFFDMWEKYMWPTIIGICAFFGFLILALIAWLLYRYRWIDRKKHDDDVSSRSSGDRHSNADKERYTELKTDGHPQADLHQRKTAASNGHGYPNHTHENHAYEDDIHHEHRKGEDEYDSLDEGSTKL